VIQSAFKLALLWHRIAKEYLPMNQITVVLSLGLLATPAPAQSNDLASVSAHLKAVTTMTAAFAQTDRSGKTLNGAITLKRPGKVRFQYEKGVPLLIVGDGKALTFIDYSVKQVQRWPIGNSPLGVLLDANKDISKFAKMVAASDPQMLVIEAKDKKHPEYGTITMAFTRQASAPAGLMLQGWVALDSQGNRTTVRLSNQKFNGAVSDEAFRWRDPRPQIKGR
jgi:outer membrane lipoprotein-sorting protein